MHSHVEEDRSDKAMLLLIGVLVVVVNLVFGVLALRDGALKLATFMLGLAVAGAVAMKKCGRCVR